MWGGFGALFKVGGCPGPCTTGTQFWLRKEVGEWRLQIGKLRNYSNATYELNFGKVTRRSANCPIEKGESWIDEKYMCRTKENKPVLN